MMKKITIFLFLLASYFSIFAQLPTKGMIAHYKFNKDLNQSIDFIEDNSTYNNHGKTYGGTNYTKDRYGTECSALWFDGNGYVQVPSSASLKSPKNEFTAVVWFKLANGADFFNQWITIICKSDITTETPDSPQYRMQATAQTVSINTAFTEKFIPQLSYDVWYFYAYTYDGKKVKVFLDGKFIFEYPYSDALTSNNLPLEIGRDLPGAEEYYFGAMDDLRIYNRALNKYELTQLYRDDTEANSPNRCLPQPPPPVNPPKIVQSPPPPTPPVQVDSTLVVNTPIDEPEAPLLPPTNNNEISSPDSLNTEDEYSGLPKEINGIPINYQQTVTVESSNIVIYPYDNEKEDGDIVSINVNGKWVKDQYMIRKKVHKPAKNILIKCKLQPGDGNYLLSKAWNLGSIGLNTLTLKINDGVATQEVMINSDEGLSGGIRIICNE